MLIEEVGKLDPFNRFVYWIRERYAIYQRRRAKRPRPWTDDTVLQSTFFTNPYRELDKTTVWFRENIRTQVPQTNDYYGDLLFCTIAFRWFNWIPTGELMLDHGLLNALWIDNIIGQFICQRFEEGHQVFTGAYMIVMASPPGGKCKAVCEQLDDVWYDRHSMARTITNHNTLESAHNTLCTIKGIGPFLGYELVSDLRHTRLLSTAPDINTWCNLGPGATFGFHRVITEEVKGALVPLEKPEHRKTMVRRPEAPPLPSDYMQQIIALLQRCKSALPDLPTLELRDIEHSLCEFHKYEQVRHGIRPKRNYDGLGDGTITRRTKYVSMKQREARKLEKQEKLGPQVSTEVKEWEDEQTTEIVTTAKAIINASKAKFKQPTNEPEPVKSEQVILPVYIQEPSNTGMEYYPV